jgi:ATP-dependent helicase/nuclease subunit A
MIAGAAPRSQLQASNPRASAFVAANAGSGKTSTLVQRVTRLLLTGADPGAILCVTYTKAGAAEMQRRLFAQLGAWAVTDSETLRAKLAEIDEAGRDISKARALFARALETPGGLKIQTLHAFCEKLLRRFPLEAGVSPSFKVMDDQESDRISLGAREAVAELAQRDPAVGGAYRRFSVELDYASFNDMFDDFAARRTAIAAYASEWELRPGRVPADVWRRCGFPKVGSAAAVEKEAMARIRWRRWREVAAVLAQSDKVTDQKLGAAMSALSETSRFAEVWALFATADGQPRMRLVTRSIDAATQAWLTQEQARHEESRARLAAATIAENTVDVLVLAIAYARLYQEAKDARGALDFGDLVTRALELLTLRADATWVLYKLDSGIEHVLLDEAQDTSPEQWEILGALTAEFFHDETGGPHRRTVFAVGDEKQSIFSFQGARPERLAAEAQAFEAKAKEARMSFANAKLLASWRSRPEILAFVDQVFADKEAAGGLTAPGTTLLRLEHKALRGAGGSIELWPEEEAEAGEEGDPLAPVDAEPARSANKLLAARIAGAIRSMVARGDMVGEGAADTPRPCRYGDFLILVRRRGVLFDEIIRSLKGAGVPLAGADRLKLSEHGVFADLVALAAFACFPADDLTLAALLRSPFCDIDESGLYDLAHARSGALWAELAARAGERPSWGEAAEFLGWAREAAMRSTPFAFYGAALGRLDGAGRSMRQRILTRLGGEAQEAVDGFLAQCLAGEGAGRRDLESFLDWMAANDIEIKREQVDGRGADEVRVMTVHGAKGLEAPIVILPDTTSRVRARGGPLLDADGGGFLWAPRQVEDCEASARARETRDKAVEHEVARLLYVGLTRARDRLIVCGTHLGKGHDKRSEQSWYDYVRRAMDALETRDFPLAGAGERTGRRFGADPAPLTIVRAAATAAQPLPAWTRGLAPPDPPAPRLASPSRIADLDTGPAPSPLAEARGLGRYRRGELIHRLLQLLPDLPATAREAAARRLLAREPGLDEVQREEMAAAALTVLADPRFAAVFGPGSRAEVPLVGGATTLPGGVAISGRVDRLVVEDGRVLVVDFKTNRPAPPRIEDADPSYVLQMAIYAAVLAEVFPGRAIEAALVWTDGPNLMPVPGAMMDRALAGLAAEA